jgi:hypothetical protein
MVQSSKAPDSTWEFTAGIKTTPQLKQGKAKLIVEATSNDSLKKIGRAERDVTVVTQPPTLSVDSERTTCISAWQTWPVSAFRIAGQKQECALAIRNFAPWPMPDGKPGLFSLYAFAWNMPTDTVPLVYGSNGAGNERNQPISRCVSEEGTAEIYDA